MECFAMMALFGLMTRTVWKMYQLSGADTLDTIP